MGPSTKRRSSAPCAVRLYRLGLVPFTRLRLEAEDRLRWHPATRAILRRYELMKVPKPGLQDLRIALHAIDRLCTAARLAPNTSVMQQVETMIQDHVLPKRKGRERYLPPLR